MAWIQAGPLGLMPSEGALEAGERPQIAWLGAALIALDLSAAPQPEDVGFGDPCLIDAEGGEVPAGDDDCGCPPGCDDCICCGAVAHMALPGLLLPLLALDQSGSRVLPLPEPLYGESRGRIWRPPASALPLRSSAAA